MGRDCIWAERDRFLLWLTDEPPRGAGLRDNTALARACCMSAFHAAGLDLRDDAALDARAADPTVGPQVRTYRRAAIAAYRRWQDTLAAPVTAPTARGGAPGAAPTEAASAPAAGVPRWEPADLPPGRLSPRQEKALDAFYVGGGAPAAVLARLTWADVRVEEAELRLRVPDELRAGFGPAAGVVQLDGRWYLPPLGYEAHMALLDLHAEAMHPAGAAAAATPLVVCGGGDMRAAPPEELRRVRQLVNARRAAELPPAVITVAKVAEAG